jgi:hypothetical protein
VNNKREKKMKEMLNISVGASLIFMLFINVVLQSCSIGEEGQWGSSCGDD